MRAVAPGAALPGIFGQDGDREEVSDEPLQAEPPRRASALTQEELFARVEGYKRLYDWLRMPGYRWGQIRNRDRYGLERRPDEPVLWVEIDPETGSERFPGQVPIEIARDRIEELGFAATPENEIELRRIDFQDALTPGQYPRVLEFAHWCLARHPAAANALSVAEEMYTRARALVANDPTPALGLARCHEAAFQFEKAYLVYRELLEGAHAEHPLVLARLAELEARLRLYARAEERLAKAERLGRTEWEVQYTYGRFLLARGRDEEAAERLLLAARHEPIAPERQRDRASVRVELGRAMLRAGDLSESASWFRKALQADPADQRAMAGLLSIVYLEGPSGLNGGSPANELDASTESSAELLLAAGLHALGRGELALARERLELAVAGDPLRAFRAFRALSYLAEVAGYPEEALRYAELACENDPTDVYSLVQRGRVLAARDDIDGAMESFSAALDRELDLADALAAMGEIQHRLGRHEAAERYLERSLSLDAGVAAVHALRGQGLLHLDQVTRAEESFRAALALDPLDESARCGLAWCAYLLGESIEAQTLLRELDDALRERPETDPHRAYARRQIERISDHEEKVVWTDRFERDQLLNDWLKEEPVGPLVDIREGAVWIQGTYTGAGRSRLKRAIAPGDFVSYEARLVAHADTRSRVGIFAAVERAGGRGTTEVIGEVTISRNPDGKVQTRTRRRDQTDAPYVDALLAEWPAGRPVVLRIERLGEAAETRFRISLDGVPVAEDLRAPSMGVTSGTLWYGAFAEGEPGRTVRLEIDDVQLIQRQR